MLGKLVRATALDLPLPRGQVLQYRLLHLWELRFLFLSSLITVVGLTCNTRAVSRMPLACIAISTIWCLTSDKRPAAREGLCTAAAAHMASISRDRNSRARN